MHNHPEMSRDAWKYTKAPKPGELKGNRYLDPKQGEPPKANSKLDGFLPIGPIACYGSDGKPFEQYDKIEIALDVEDETFTTLESMKFFEDKKLALPSFALTCAALVWLFKHRKESAARSILDQYEDNKTGCGIHLQNTIILPEDWVLIHYPMYNQGKMAYNKNSSVKLPFTVRQRGCIHLEEALKDPNMENSLKNLTGLADLLDLNKIALYFVRELNFWPPGPDYKGIIGTGLGVDLEFEINAEIKPSAKNAARGVRLAGGGSK